MENGKENLIPSMGMSDFGPKQYFYNAELLYIIESYQRLTIDVLKAKGIDEDQIPYIQNNFIIPNILDLVFGDGFFNIEIPNENIKDIGKRIKSAREFKNITQKDLVKLSGIPTKSVNEKMIISRLEHGNIKSITLGRIISIAKALGVTVEYLINGDER